MYRAVYRILFRNHGFYCSVELACQIVFRRARIPAPAPPLRSCCFFFFFHPDATFTSTARHFPRVATPVIRRSSKKICSRKHSRISSTREISFGARNSRLILASRPRSEDRMGAVINFPGTKFRAAMMLKERRESKVTGRILWSSRRFSSSFFSFFLSLYYLLFGARPRYSAPQHPPRIRINFLPMKSR